MECLHCTKNHWVKDCPTAIPAQKKAALEKAQAEWAKRNTKRAEKTMAAEKQMDKQTQQVEGRMHLQVDVAGVKDLDWHQDDEQEGFSFLLAEEHMALVQRQKER